MVYFFFSSQFGPSGQCQLPEMRQEVDPDLRDSHRDLVEIHIQRIRGYIEKHFPHIDHREPAIVEACTYTVCKYLRPGSRVIFISSTRII